MTEKAATTQNIYDAVPYASYPYPGAQPERLYTVGKLFGMQPVDFAKCKVLELGCASGGNLIPVASMYPESGFLGVDLSEVQVKAGQEQIAKLGLKNIELKAISIADINAKFGKFDYIIAHGVLSWVSKDIQDKIFDVCSKNLTKNGIAYVSYNTLPGWNAAKSIREMVRYHTQGFEKPEDKIREAKLLLKFVKEANVENKTSYSKSLDEEIETLNLSGDAYLLHDHLAENNEPFYFNQVAGKAVDSGLQYVGDTSVASMYPGNLPQETAKVLASAGDDIVRVEQYMDFVRNRRFRASLFCNKDIVLNRNLKPEVLEDFYVTAQITANEDLRKVDLTKRNEVVINFSNGVSVTTSNPSVILAMGILQAQRGKPIATKELLSKVADTGGASANKEAARQAILGDLLRLVFADAIGIGSTSGQFITEITEKPKASELARLQAAQSDWITNQKSEKAVVDLFNRVLIQYLDGKNDFDAILGKMVTHVENDDLALNIDGKKLSDKKQIRDVLTEVTKRNIENLAPLAVLVA